MNPFGILSFNRRLSDLAKRTFDMAAASLGLIILSPFLVLIGIFIKRDSPGPIFYRGLRTGKKGKLFRILKLRTMYECVNSYNGPRVTPKDDCRITRLGRWLRNTKLNELPQLWNVICGDMSLVGPRPEDPEIIKEYPKSIRDEVLSVRPGITSPASVLYHSEENLLSSKGLMEKYLKDILPDKLRFDQLYVRYRSFATDIDTVLRTLTIFIPRIAEADIAEGLLFAGPFARFIQRYLSWFLVDMLVAFTSVLTACIIWYIQNPFLWALEHMAILAVSLALLFSIFNYLAGLNRIIWPKAASEDVIGLFFIGGLVTLFVLVFNQLQGFYNWMPYPALPIEFMLLLCLIAQFGFISARYRFPFLAWLVNSWLDLRRNASGVGEHILIVGDGEVCQIANWLLRKDMFRRVFSIVGIVATDDPTKQGMRLNGSWVVGGIRDLPSLIRKHDVQMIIYTAPKSADYIRDTVFTLCSESGAKVAFLDDLLAFICQNPNKPFEARDHLEWLQQRADSVHLRDIHTGLPNRTLLQERVRHSLVFARRYNTKPALMFIELNRLGTFNSFIGVTIEEALMEAVARRLEAIKRESDTLARYKVDGFALLLENIPDDTSIEAVIKRAKSSMAKPFLMEGKELSLDINIMTYLPVEDIRDAKDLNLSNFEKHFARWEKTMSLDYRAIDNPA
jgi:diguanylate cyclase (GGDEF)-like protein